VSDCSHPRLIHVVNYEFGGLESTTYKCEKCNNLLTVAIKPLEPVKVVYAEAAQ